MLLIALVTDPFSATGTGVGAGGVGVGLGGAFRLASRILPTSSSTRSTYFSWNKSQKKDYFGEMKYMLVSLHTWNKLEILQDIL